MGSSDALDAAVRKLWNHDVAGGDAICLHMPQQPFAVTHASAAFGRLVADHQFARDRPATLVELMANEAEFTAREMYGRFVRVIQSARPRSTLPRLTWKPFHDQSKVLETQMHVIDTLTYVSVTRDVTLTAHKARRAVYKASITVHRTLVHALNDSHKNSVLRALTYVENANNDLQAMMAAVDKCMGKDADGAGAEAAKLVRGADETRSTLAAASHELHVSLAHFSLECARHEISAGAYVVNPTWQDVRALFAGAHAFPAVSVRVAGAVGLVPSLRVPDVFLDPTPMRLAVADALANARAYGLPPFCVDIAVRSGELLVSVSNAPGTDHHRMCEVLNDKETLERLFEQDLKLYDALAGLAASGMDDDDTASDGSNDGVPRRRDLGAGLRFLRTAAKMLGGDVSLELTPTSAKTTIRCPVTVKSEGRRLCATDVLAMYRIPPGATVLVVDDSRVVRTTMKARAKKHLCTDGVELAVLPDVRAPDESADARDALGRYEETLSAMVTKGRVVLLTDQNLGAGLPLGTDVIAAVRARVPHAQYNLVAFVVSANTEGTDRQYYLSKGADGVMGKGKDDLLNSLVDIMNACTRRFEPSACRKPKEKEEKGGGGKSVQKTPTRRESNANGGKAAPASPKLLLPLAVDPHKLLAQPIAEVPAEAQARADAGSDGGSSDTTSTSESEDEEDSDSDSLFTDSDSDLDFSAINIDPSLLSAIGMPLPSTPRYTTTWKPPSQFGLGNSEEIQIRPEIEVTPAR